ncbi:hypothetical protein N0P70_005424 [Klebsiella michiganensis]|nr:hypothetical protein [Klebsiella michiganensis]
MQNRITSSRQFVVGEHTISFAAGIMRGKAVLVTGIKTGIESVPVFTVERLWPNTHAANAYISALSVSDAELFLTDYRDTHLSTVEKVNRALTRTGFIAPQVTPGRYPKRGSR